MSASKKGISMEMQAYHSEVQMRPNFGQTNREYRAMLRKRKKDKLEVVE